MTTQRIRITSISLVLVLALSGLSFGFLVGRSQQHSAEAATDSIQQVTAGVQSSSAVVTKVVRGLQHMLIQ